MITRTKPFFPSPAPNPLRDLRMKWPLVYLFIVVISLCTMYTHSLYAQLIEDGIAAIVNTEINTISDLETELRDETVRLRARYVGEEL